VITEHIPSYTACSDLDPGIGRQYKFLKHPHWSELWPLKDVLIGKFSNIGLLGVLHLGGQRHCQHPFAFLSIGNKIQSGEPLGNIQL
jgi:hypothetical protein